MKIQVVNQSKKKFSVTYTKQVCKKLFLQFKNNKKIKFKKARDNDFNDLTVAFVDKKTSQKLNLTYRNKKYPTDVLSFSNQSKGQGLGELVLCLDVLQKQARQQGHSLKTEVAIMLTHGFLHLLGYDHEKSLKDERKMMKIQNETIRRLTL